MLKEVSVMMGGCTSTLLGGDTPEAVRVIDTSGTLLYQLPPLMQRHNVDELFLIAVGVLTSGI